MDDIDLLEGKELNVAQNVDGWNWLFARQKIKCCSLIDIKATGAVLYAGDMCNHPYVTFGLCVLTHNNLNFFVYFNPNCMSIF